MNKQHTVWEGQDELKDNRKKPLDESLKGNLKCEGDMCNELKCTHDIVMLRQVIVAQQLILLN